MGVVSESTIKPVFTVGSIVALWGLNAIKQSHDGLLLHSQAARVRVFIHSVLTDRPDEAKLEAHTYSIAFFSSGFP